MIHPQSQEADRACLQEGAAIEGGMLRSEQRGVQLTARRSQAGGIAGGWEHAQLTRFAVHPQPIRATFGPLSRETRYFPEPPAPSAAALFAPAMGYPRQTYSRASGRVCCFTPPSQ